MSETTARILFMDDEPYSDVVIQALARLREVRLHRRLRRKSWRGDRGLLQPVL
jgi:hypothetical protein